MRSQTGSSGAEEEPMHPEILRELISQRGREMRDQAHQATLARMATKIRRARRRGLSGLEDGAEIVLPPRAAPPKAAMTTASSRRRVQL
jgi:hypothetical protein